jgi:tRNA dimethylallyltransferase
LEEVVAQIRRDTRRFIRQQYNWFRLEDEMIAWIDVSGEGFEAEVMEKVRAFLVSLQ